MMIFEITFMFFIEISGEIKKFPIPKFFLPKCGIVLRNSFFNHFSRLSVLDIKADWIWKLLRYQYQLGWLNLALILVHIICGK